MDLDYGALEDLAEAMASSKSLIVLDLGACNIDDKEAQIVADDLKENCSIKKLILTGKKISLPDIKALATALKMNSVLTDLYLDENSTYNPASSENLKALMEVLQVNQHSTFSR